jgi:hypothetical protein
METNPANLRSCRFAAGDTFYSLYSIHTIYILHCLVLDHILHLQYKSPFWDLKTRMLHFPPLTNCIVLSAHNYTIYALTYIKILHRNT